MSFPNEIRMKYPLPKFLQRLPEDKQIGLKNIYLNDSLTIHQSYRKLREYLQTFNKEELRQVYRPNGFVNIPKMLQDNIDAVIDKNGKFAQLSRLNSEFYEVVENLTVRDFNHASMKDSKYLLEEYYPPYRGYPRNLAMDVVYDGGRIGIPR
uniref:Uncharacterized protein n=1 Tax=Panagrolaimus davidi TaxID=227884 RepID=A0A914QVZ3_9BILA